MNVNQYEKIIRREIADTGFPRITTVIDMIRTMRELERKTELLNKYTYNGY